MGIQESCMTFGHQESFLDERFQQEEDSLLPAQSKQVKTYILTLDSDKEVEFKTIGNENK